MISIEDINIAIVSALGIDYEGGHVTGVDICLRVGDLPRVTVHSLLVTPQVEPFVEHITNRYVLKPDNDE